MISQKVALERAALALLLCGECELLSVLKPEDFSVKENRLIFEEALSLFRQGKEPDLLTISERVSSRDGPSQEEVLSILSEVLDSVHTRAGARKVAEKLRELSRKQALRDRLSEFLSCFDFRSYDEIRNELKEIAFSFSEQEKSEKEFFTSSDLCEAVSEYLARRIVGEEKLIKTGYAFDELIGGFERGGLYVFAARPGAGKTSLALNISLRCARQGIPVCFFSLEMSAPAIGMRLLSIESGIEFSKLRLGELSASEEEALTAAMNAISELPIEVFADSFTSSDLTVSAQKMADEKGFFLLIVDYLQLVRGSRKKYSTRQEEVEEVVESLRGIAKSLKIPVISLSQLNRRIEDRPSRKPVLSDLRDSGHIEQAADVVAFIHREDEARKDEVEIVVSKNRSGETGSCRLLFHGKTLTFENLKEGGMK